ncbi:MAG TPA: SDR family oxidoreductase [Acidimicrobiales bacterium]
MRVFVTGASGFIGSAVVRELLGAGHEVVGLARSEESVATVSAAGAQVFRGSLDDPDSLAQGAALCDGVIHLAYKHDFTDMAAAAQDDLRAVEAMGAVLEGSNKPLVITTGTLALAFGFTSPIVGRSGTEVDVPDIAGPRIISERAALALAQRGVRTSTIRLSPSVHGRDDHGFVPRLIAIARAKGVSAFVGDGANRWPAVHRLDAAILFRLALEHATAGSTFHGVGDEGIAFADIAGAIGRHLGVPVTSITGDEAGDHFGFMSVFVALDNPTSSRLTQDRLGWQPVQPGLLVDLEEGHYFQS